MRRSNHTDAEIVTLLKEAEAGVPIQAICAAAFVSTRTFYRWRKQLGGLSPDALRRLRTLEQENQHLRLLVARLSERNTGGVWCGVSEGSGAPRSEFGAVPTAGTKAALSVDPERPKAAGSTIGRYAQLRMGPGR